MLSCLRLLAAIGLASVPVLVSPVVAGAAGTVSAVAVAATEGTTFTGAVATYNGTCSPIPCAATIAWGDGSSSPAGTFTGSSGSWTIPGTHIYADEGSFPIVVTVNDNGGAPSGSGTATVSDADVLTVSALGLATTEGSPLSSTVAFLHDTNSANLASDFTATINWGDGTTSPGTIAGAAGSFVVTGTHTYADEGSFGLSVTVSDDSPGAATATGTSTITANDADLLLTVATTGGPVPEGLFTGLVATFSDPNVSNVASDFIVTIDWGDGTASAGTVTGSSGFFLVNGTHTYADEGTFIRTVTVTDAVPSTGTAPVTVNEADTLTVSVGSTAIVEGGFSGAVATFTDTNATNVASDFTATIDWGDGAFSAGTVTGSAGAFTVSGAHAYAEDGIHTMVVTVLDDTPGTSFTTGTGSVSVAELALVAAGVAAPPSVEGTAFSGTVATFTDAGSPDPASSFAATINWGDGTTSPGTVTGAAGSYSVSGAHTYADEGTFTVTVTADETNSPSVTAHATTTITVAEADVVTSSTTPVISSVEGSAFGGVIAHFTDSGPSNTASDFTATVNWGDGTTSAAVVTAAGGGYDVSGPHTYAEEGSYPLSITLSDDAPGTASATVTGNATVLDAVITGTAAAQTATVGVQLVNVTVGTFTDQDKEAPSNYTATIHWGDGTTSAGTITDPPGTVHVLGSHTYSAVGSFSLTVTLVDAGGVTVTTAPATVTVGALPFTAGPPKPVPVLPLGLIGFGVVLLAAALVVRVRARAD